MAANFSERDLSFQGMDNLVISAIRDMIMEENVNSK